MIEKSQHSTPNKDKRYEEWMFRADIPDEWSNDNVDVADQPYERGYPFLTPYERGYPFLAPIERIEDEEHPDGVFRFPHNWEMGIQKIEQLIEKQGTDALAWYRPFHMDPQEKWGITILDQGIWYLARKLATEFSAPYDDEDTIKYCRDIAKDFLYYHEMFHFKVELAATVMEIFNPNEPLYARYWKPQSRGEWFDSEVKSNREVKSPLEEALANSYALRQVCSLHANTDSANIDVFKVKNAIEKIMEMQPNGYRHAKKLPYGLVKWKRAMNELLDRLMNQEDSQEWVPGRIVATHVLFDGVHGKDDWIEEYYEGVVPCRILNTGFAEGRFAAIDKFGDTGIFCVTNKFKRDMKNYPNPVIRYLEKSCLGFAKYTDGKGMANYEGYEAFSTNADHWSKAERFKGVSKSQADTKVYYYQLMGRNGYRVYHEQFEGEDVLLRTHKKITQRTPTEVKDYLYKTPRPSTMAKHEPSCPRT